MGAAPRARRTDLSGFCDRHSGRVWAVSVDHERISAARPLVAATQLMPGLIGRRLEGVADVFGLQQLVDLRLGEGRIGSKVQSDAPLRVVDDHLL
jgi:hypothetical protein